MRKIKLTKKQTRLLVVTICIFLIGFAFAIAKQFVIQVEAYEGNTQKEIKNEEQVHSLYRERREREDKDYAKIAKETAQKMTEVLKHRNQLNEFKKATGLDVVGFKKKDIIISHYGDTYEQNGGYPNITCTGAKLSDGMVASNVYPLGTKFYWNGKVYTVADKGGSHFDRYDRLDVFVPRNKGENDRDYIKRIYKYGKKTVSTHILETK